MNKILLDTNSYTRLLTGDETVLDAVSDAEIVYMSVFVLGELYAGFKGGSREEKNRGLLSDFLDRRTVHILPATEQTAEIFGELHHGLKTTGRPIPINDLWIASQAVESGSFIITFDEHFSRIPGLLLWKR